MKHGLYFFFAFLLCIAGVQAQTVTTCAEINAVDEDGKPTFPGLQTMDRYTIEGVALNTPSIFNGESANSFILFVQDDTGGIQVFSGSFYGGGMPIYQNYGVKQGDRVRVTGLTGFYGGKTNINDRHNKDNTFEIATLGQPGDPQPMPINDLAAAREFDQTRQSGGEYYQGRLVVLKNVRIVDGEWANGGMLTVEDPSGGQLNVELRYKTGIGDHPKPEGLLNIVGIFNQEDVEPPHKENYLVWPRSVEDFQPASSGVPRWYMFE